MLDMLEKEEMVILNAISQCKGKWTRQEGKNKSVIDYMIIREEDVNNVKSVYIDDEHIKTLFRMEIKDKGARTVYTDHNAMECDIEWRRHSKVQKKQKKIMTNKSYMKFRKKLEDSKVSDIWNKKGSIQALYDEWSEKVMSIKKGKEEKR